LNPNWRQIRLLATDVLCTTLVLPRLAAAQTVPAIPPSNTTSHQVESRIEAKQNVKVLKLDVDVAAQDATTTKVDLAYQQYQKGIFDKLAQEQAVREDVTEQWLSRVKQVIADDK
jgi:hypothetical protein